MEKISFLKKCLIVFFFGIIPFGKAQNPSCDSTTPYFYVDMTNNPAGVWASPNISRNDHCCGVTGADQCVSLDVVLDSNAAGIQIDMIGADPAGALFYQINCVGSYPGGTIKCISGSGLQHITFCKPGNNKNIYQVTSISKPFFPFDDTVRIGCTTQLTTFGVLDNQTNWTSIYPGATGDYNSYLSCTNCASPVYTPIASAPAYIEYQVCGFPQASTCGYNAMVCDTVRIYNLPSLAVSINPVNATFCDLGPGSGITLTASGVGGLPPYSYTWINSLNVVVGTGSTYFATQAGNYTVEVKDALYNSSTCPSFSKTIAVVIGTLPVVNAGADQKVCATSPVVSLNGTVQYATGGVWSGGSGIFNPGNTFLNTNYTPSSSEIIAGSVTLTLTSTGAGGNCINQTDQITLFFSDSIKVNVAGPLLNCYGNTTTLTANVTGGTPPLTYQWNTGFTSSSITTGQGNYSVTVTDYIGCTGTSAFNLISPPPLTIGFSLTDVTITGGNDGSATVIPGGGTSPYSILWSNGDSTTTTDSLTYGVYTVTIVDFNGCIISGSVVISEPPCIGFNVTATSGNVLCYNANNGIGMAIATGGTPPYTYSWNDSLLQANDTAFNLAPGAYTITVQDSLNCFQSANITINEPLNLTNSMTHINVTTVGGTNGSATANPFGGTSPYSYSWSNGSLTQTINTLAAGNYVVTITDANACSMIDSVYINEPPCTSLTLNVVTTNVACYGGNTGSATANVSNAVPPYTILWSNGQTGFVANGLVEGNYTVAITDAINCTQFVNFTITEPPLLSVSISPNDIICNNAYNGTIDLAIAGGTFPYSFNWSNGASTEDLINLGPGNYSVIVLDQHGCKVNASSQIIEPGAFEVSGIVINASCIYGSDGAINLTVNGGTAPYVYSWSNGATTQDVNGLQAGGYVVTITDANNCQSLPPSFFAIKQPDSIGVSSFTVACPLPGSGNSFVTVVPTGGSNGTYQVSFDNGVSFQTPGDYDAYLPNGGTYYVIFKDDKSCISISPDTIVVKPEVAVTSVTFNNCFPLGTTSTLVTVNAGGGDNGPYSVSYDNGLTFQNPGTMSFNLPLGNTYNIVVKDARGCESLPTNIIIPDVLLSSATSPIFAGAYNITCNGATNGSIDLSVTGGTTGYSYSWTGPGSYSSTSQNLTGLAAGTYNVTVTDANGCIRTTSITLTEPATLIANATSPTVSGAYNITCNGLKDGAINLAVIGGTTSYSFAWTGPGIFYSILQNPTGLDAGSYSVTVTDANGCTAITSIVLTQPDPLTASAIVSTLYGAYNISCNGLTDGAVDLTVTGGVPVYNYSWSNSVSSEDQSNIGEGTYSVLITDLNGCITNASAKLSEPQVLLAELNSTSDYNGFGISCFGLENGNIDIGVSGGTPIYQYTWSSGAITQDISNVAAGNYAVIITDGNNCQDTLSVTLTQPDPLTILIDSVSNFNGYGVSCNHSTDGAINISVAGGVTPYYYMWNNGDVTEDISELGSGLYSITSIDANGCLNVADTLIKEPLALVPSTISVNPGCNGSTTGSIDLSLNGGVSPYSYSWNNGATTQDLENLSIGNYTMIFADSNSCGDTVHIALTEPQVLSAVIAKRDISCFGDNNGLIDVTVSGGTKPYIYSWSNGANTTNLSNLSQGTYIVTIKDAEGCLRKDTLQIMEPDSLVLTLASPQLPNGHNISSYTGKDGSIDLTVNGGTLPYSYLWSTNSTDEDLQSLSSGEYAIVVTDNNGCSANGYVALSQPLALEMPTGYSPNSDGRNDNFIVRGIEAFPDNEMTVYNRWGNIVYHKKNYLNEWNGLNTNGDELPDATYFVIIEIKIDNTALKGYVELKRN